MPAGVWLKIPYIAGIDGKVARKLAPLNSELAEAARTHEDNDGAAAAVRAAAERRSQKPQAARHRAAEKRAREAQAALAGRIVARKLERERVRMAKLWYDLFGSDEEDEED